MIFWCSIFVLFVFQGIFMLGRWNWYPAYNKTSEAPNFKERCIIHFYHKSDTYEVLGAVGSILAGMTVAIMLAVIINNNQNYDAEVAQLNETYAALQYKISTEFENDELGLIKKEIIDEIQEWNETVVYNKERSNDFWIGIFQTKAYDNFDTIPYTP